MIEYCLSSDPNRPCYVLRFKEITLMLDCGLSTQTVLNFLPLPLVPSARLNNLPGWMPRDVSDPQLEGELKECCGRVFVDSAPEFFPPQPKIIDFSEVDVILISNYLCMLALPFITEGTGFAGVVYATEPTLQIGRLFLEELVQHIEQTPKATLASHWKEHLHVLPSPLCDSQKPRSWRHIYNMRAVNSSLARIQMVGYNEKLDVYGAVGVMPVSSGYCLGSSNWVISSHYEKVTYVSGSSTLTTHPRPMDQTALKNANVLILTGLTQTPTANPDSMLGELCMTVATTLRCGGSVLIPCYPSGVVYDLFECLSSHLDNSGMATIPMFFISPVADTSLAYSNILAEWLSTAKQNKVYLPEEPFPHAFLVRNGRLKHFKHIYTEGFSTDYRQPCVVFCGHPSLRFGDAVHFVELWGSSALNTIVFTEPDFPYLEALAPFQPLAMKAVHCPIDTSLNFTQANKLIRDLRPGTLVLPESYTLPPVTAPHRIDLVVETDRPIISFKRDEVLTLPLKRRQGRVELSPELAEFLLPSEVRTGVSLSTLTGGLQVKDNKHILKVLEVGEPKAVSTVGKKRIRLVEDILNKKPSNYTWGSLDIDEFIQKITQEGITDAKVEQVASGYIIHLQNEDTLIQVEDSSTHIFCEGDEQLRLRLRNILLQCLNKF
ncbi:Integrator complex subunit 9 [Cryptotermes secundus]|uniref:Integrator complex subunit 9 n=1 Tax=Cryptotermes secundus TaxID=105785 RepID=A0A2J7QAJ4_9NEOP|nr:integrator complex subunit 9 isoform X3 [Cryptotermes secundus]PNF25606.1 Integrator complex subunit 9 [Cryptotermes secundus]